MHASRLRYMTPAGTIKFPNNLLALRVHGRTKESSMKNL